MIPPQSGHALVIDVAMIPAKGLAFEAEIAPELLHLPREEVLTFEASVRVQGLFTKASEQIYFRGTLRGVVTVPCSRCLETVWSDFVTEVRVVFFPQTSEVAAEEESRLSFADELDLYMHDGITLDLKPLVRDQVVLSFPVQPMCRDDCAGLCQVCGGNRNEQPCACQVGSEDSRFAILKHWSVSQSS